MRVARGALVAVADQLGLGVPAEARQGRRRCRGRRRVGGAWPGSAAADRRPVAGHLPRTWPASYPSHRWTSWRRTTPKDALDSTLAVAPLGVPYELFACDPALADTAAFCAAYGFDPGDSGEHRSWSSARAIRRASAACVTLAPYRLDVNRAVRDRLGTRKASFAPAEATAELTGMQMGGVTGVRAAAGPADLGGRPGHDP